jgi:transketolase
MMEAMATRDAYGQALVEMGEQNRSLVVLDADLAMATKTVAFKTRFPERFFDMGIAEQSMIGTAAGLALAGKIPFASSFAVFATGRAFEQIRNSVAYPKVNVKIAATHAGITVGEDGASHQSVADISLMRSLPNMTVLVPADGVETAQAVRAAAEFQGPVYLRLGRLKVPVVVGEDHQFRIGPAYILRQGADAVVFACGIMVGKALEAALELAKEGIGVAVVNVPTIKPFDCETVVKVAQLTGAVVTAEEHSVIGGLGSAVAEVLSQQYPVPLEMVGIRDCFGESGSPDQLLAKYGLTGADIMNAVKKVMLRKTER